LNGPTYEINADANKTSPATTLIYYDNVSIEFSQRVFSDPKALTNL